MEKPHSVYRTLSDRGEDLGICVLFNSQTSLASSVIPELHELVKNVMNTPVEGLELGKLASAY